ncbi:MAG TPA: serine hydrolase domain-containing protein [Actinophytocola sp.]|nr:serine hydrolase domain-containing protein [Actinophytocola sp.]
MRRTIAVLAAAAALVVTGAGGASADTVPPLEPSTLRAAIAGLPDDETSGALLRVRGSAGRWQGTSGVANVHTGRRVPLHGRFRLGSITKTFVATAALQLVARDRLDLDRTVQSYLPDALPEHYPPIAVRQLLNYTSGLPGVDIDHKDPEWFLANRFRTWTPHELLGLAFTGRDMLFEPGTWQHYGNIDYLVLGLVIEQVTGRPYAHAIRSGIIRPLHLRATSVPGRDPHIHGPHARGYEEIDGRYVDITDANPTFQWAAAEMISNAPDLDRFLVALMAGRLLPPAETALLFDIPDVKAFDGDGDPTNDADAQFGLGLGRFPVGDVVFWGKTGDRPGYNNGMAATLDLSRRVVYSVNTLHMGGSEQPEVPRRIIAAVGGLA